MTESNQMFPLFEEMKKSIDRLSEDLRDQSKSIALLQNDVKHVEARLGSLYDQVVGNYATKQELEMAKKLVQNVDEKVKRHDGYFYLVVSAIVLSVMGGVLKLVILN